MARPDFDWTFDDAPAEGEARPQAAEPNRQRPRPTPTGPDKRARRLRWSRRRWIAVVGLTAAAVLLGGWLVSRVGWLRLEGQIAAEVAYDDARSRAREVQAVLAAQVTNDAFWTAQRTAEVKLGLPAPLPAGNLLPTVYPAEVVQVQTLGGSVFAATVRRRFADSAGQVYSFDLVQRYLNVAPGTWQRLSTDLNGLVAATIVSGARLSATVPISDLPWLTPALTAADGLLIDACAAWQTCPDDYKLQLYFNVGAELLNPTQPERAATTTPGGYPIIFDLGGVPPGFPPRYVLSAPQLTGRPANAEAQAAYNRAIGATALGYMAGAIAHSARGHDDYFLVALVARMEARLGLSAPAAPLVPPLAFRSPDELWNLTAAYDALGRAELDQVWALLEVTLDGQPPEVDGALLRTVHGSDVEGWEAWLAAALMPDEAARAAAAWVAYAQQGLAPPTAADWAAAEGLVLACPDRLMVVKQGFRNLLQPGFQPPAFMVAELDPRLATERYRVGQFFVPGDESNRLEIWLFDQQPRGRAVLVDDFGFPLGWGADGGLYFVDLGSPDTGNEQSPPLLVYDPITLQTSMVLPNVSLMSAPELTADHQAVLLTRMSADDQGDPITFPMLVRLGTPLRRQVLAESGYAATLAPGSTATEGRVAYFVSGREFGARWLHVEVLDLASGEAEVLVDSELAGGGISDGSNLVWSPGGQWLSFIGFPGWRVFTVEAATGTLREWHLAAEGESSYIVRGFSADDRYAAVGEVGNPSLAGTMTVLDLTAAGSEPVLRVTATDSAWSPGGHTLAVTNALGVFLVDPATGEYHWLQPEPCDVSW